MVDKKNESIKYTDNPLRNKPEVGSSESTSESSSKYQKFVTTAKSVDPSIIFYGIFAGVSMLCLIVAFFLSGLPAYGLEATGYGLLFFAMVSLGIYIYSRKDLTKYVIGGIGFYMFIILIAIGFKLYSLIVYKDILTSDTTYYSYFNKPIFGLMFLQILLIGFYFIKKIKPDILALICLLGVVTLNAAISDFQVLKYFHADGFCSGCHR